MEKNDIKRTYLILILVLILMVVFSVITHHPKPIQAVYWHEKGSLAVKNRENTRISSRLVASKPSHSPLLGPSAAPITAQEFSRKGHLSDKAKNKLIAFKYQSFLCFECMRRRTLSGFKAFEAIFTQVRALSLTLLSQTISPPHDLLVGGMVFGGNQAVDPDTRHYFEVTGMLHVTSASGYNVGLITQLGLTLFSRFWGRRLIGLGLAGLVISYGLMAGFSPSLLRATMMGLTMVAGRWLGCRPYYPLWGWLISITTLSVVQPALISEVGFQLSAAASLGIVLFAPLWVAQPSWLTQWENQDAKVEECGSSPKSWGQKFVGFLKEATALTVAAQLFTLPLLVHHFGEIASLSVLANVALGWLTPLITLGGVGVIAGSWFALLCPVCQWPVQLLGQTVLVFVLVFTRVNGWLGGFEQSVWQVGHISLELVVVWWIVVLYWWWSARPPAFRPPEWLFREQPKLI